MSDLTRIRVGVVCHEGKWYPYVEDQWHTKVAREGYEDREDALVVAKMECERIRLDLEARGIDYVRTV